MAINRTQTLDQAFDDHPSLCASLEDFEQNENRSPVFGLPSQHSGFKLDGSEADGDGDADSNPERPWSPPAWRKQSTAGGWYRHQPYASQTQALKPSFGPARSKEANPLCRNVKDDELDINIPANIPLPRGSQTPAKERSASPPPAVNQEQDFRQTFEREKDNHFSPENGDNYFRFAVRAEVQHRTEPIETALSWIRAYMDNMSKSWISLSSSLSFLAFAYIILSLLTHTPVFPPAPDLVKVAGLARSFEPLIFYSENGLAQIGDLQETGVAVWDLGESVRSANMTSVPIIVGELDNLSESLKSLGHELTRFFNNVDGDIDSILNVMEWAKRELDALSSIPQTSLSSAFTNIHILLSHLGILENRATGLPTRMGTLFTDLFGVTRSQRTQQTLHRTFNEFLGVLEESINSELTYSTSLFALFESIDRQFLNLQRTVIRESDTQERLEGELLGSLWVRIMGADASMLRKYEKNKELLSSVRAKTISHKSLLMEYSGKLIALKGNLEMLRRKLVSPLVRRENGSTIGVEEQVRGLEGTYHHLKAVREKQRGRVLEGLYGLGGKTGKNGASIEAR